MQSTERLYFSDSGRLEFSATVIAVIEEESIAGAARRLGITAGAVALRVRTVEAELGAKLIEHRMRGGQVFGDA